MMGNGMIGQGMGIWMLLGLLFWVLLIVGIIFLLIWAVQRISGGRIEKEESALDILKKRYAKGEISKEEYEEKRRDISDIGTSPPVFGIIYLLYHIES